jgi:hypothetical protein
MTLFVNEYGYANLCGVGMGIRHDIYKFKYTGGDREGLGAHELEVGEGCRAASLAVTRADLTDAEDECKENHYLPAGVQNHILHHNVAQHIAVFGVRLPVCHVPLTN